MPALGTLLLYYTDEQGLKTKSAAETAPCTLCMVGDLGEATPSSKEQWTNGTTAF